uniref:Target of rapamycin complex subunit lst8 n=1 Tax=Cyclopterus lumpus TaxID=8103 RepID=A0A8C2WYG2_CYCLU
MNVNQGTVGSDPVILATAGYDHTVRFWQAHSGICTRTVQHQDSQVNSLEVTPDRSMIAAAGWFTILPVYRHWSVHEPWQRGYRPNIATSIYLHHNLS